VVRHSGKLESHLDAAQRAHQHEVVEIAKVSDAKNFAGEFGEPAAERHVEVVQHHAAEGIGIVTFRHQYRGERIAVLDRIGAEDLESPCADGLPSRFTMAATREDAGSPSASN
jgi:hypothetical protein